MKIEELAEFRRDMKRLLKKYRTLNDDLSVVKKVLYVRPHASPPFSFEINNLEIDTCVIKVKKIACKSLKGKGVNSGLRLIYALFEAEQRIVFVEIYHKNTQTNEDRARIKKHFK